MAWRKKPVYEDEYEDDEEYEDDYEDDYKDEVKDQDANKAKEKVEYDEDDYDDDYDDDDYYDDEEDYRNPLKPVVIVMAILILLLAAIGALLYMRLQSAEKQNTELSASLSTTQTELNRVKAEAAAQTAQTPAVVDLQPVETAAPEATPEPEPTATPEPTPEPTPVPTPVPSAPKDTTDEMLAGAVRPVDASWYPSVRTAKVNAEYMLSVHWGPGMEYFENMVLYNNNEVETLAQQNGWTLLRTKEGKYGWALSGFLTETQTVAATDAPPI